MTPARSLSVRGKPRPPPPRKRASASGRWHPRCTVASEPSRTVLSRPFFSLLRTRLSARAGSSLCELAAHTRLPVCAAYHKELLAKAAALPETAVYRTSVEAVSEHSITVMESGNTDSEVEAELARGQLEEMLLEVKDELNLMENMSAWRPWEGASLRFASAPPASPSSAPAHAAADPLPCV